jgi:hypothetical protein
MSGGNLFSDGQLCEYLGRARRQAEEALLCYEPDELLLAPEADVTAYLVGLGTVSELVLHRDDTYQLDPTEITKRTRNDWDISRLAQERRVTRYTVVTPFSGDPALFRLRASTWTTSAPWGDVHGQELRLYWDNDFGTGTAELIKLHINNGLNGIEQHLGFLNRDIAEHNKAIANEMPGRVAARRAKHLADKQMQSNLGFPLKTQRDAAAYTIPLTRQRLAPARPPQQRGQAFTPEPTLAEADYEDALQVLRNCRNGFERSPSTAAKLNEEEIRDLLLINLNARFGGRAAGEVFNGAGKTDILIRVEDRNVFIGECKIWRGPKKFSEAIDQLLTYTTWRDTKAALLIFVKSGDVTAITEKAVTALSEHPNFKRHGIHATEDRHDGILHANSDPNREIRLALMLFLIPAITRTPVPD